MSAGRRGRRLLGLAILGLVGLAAVTAWREKERRERYSTPIARIAGSAIFGRFLEEERLALLRPDGTLEVWSLAGGEPELTAQHVESTTSTFLSERGLRRGFPVEIHADVVNVRALATGAVIATTCVDSTRGYMISAAASPRHDVLAIGRRTWADGSQEGEDRVEVRALKDSTRVRWLDLGKTKVDAPQPWFVFEPSLARLHCQHGTTWMEFSLLDGKKTAERPLPPGADLFDRLGTGELLLFREHEAELLALAPDTGKVRRLASGVVGFDLDGASARLLAREGAERVVIDVETAEVVWRRRGGPVPDVSTVGRLPADFDGAIAPSGERVAFEVLGVKGASAIEVWRVPPQ